MTNSPPYFVNDILVWSALLTACLANAYINPLSRVNANSNGCINIIGRIHSQLELDFIA